jgi:rhamnose transport system permease protein
MTAAPRKVTPFTHEILLAVVLLALLLVARHVDAAFVSVAAQQGLYSHVWDLAILALPMTLIIITGGIDLSIGSTMALVSVTLGILYKDHAWPLAAACAAAMLVGALCGLVNGVFIAKVRVHPLIVTLATFSAYKGLAEGISSARIYSGFPNAFVALGTHALLADPARPRLYHLPAAGWFFVAAALAAAVVLARAPFGRSLYAMGFNETAARFSGIKVDRIKLLIYTLSGLFAALVSINFSALRDTAKAGVGAGMELDVITAVVLGGTSIFGGRGRILGTLLGVALIHETREFVSWHYNKAEWVPLVIGSLLIVAVAANALLTRKSLRN